MKGLILVVLTISLFLSHCESLRAYRPSSALSPKAFAAFSARNAAARKQALLKRQRASQLASSQRTGLSSRNRYGGLASVSANRPVANRNSATSKTYPTVVNRRLPSPSRSNAYKTSSTGRKSVFSRPFNFFTKSNQTRNYHHRKHSGHSGTSHGTPKSSHHRPTYGALRDRKPGIITFNSKKEHDVSDRVTGISRGRSNKINIESPILAPLPPKPHLQTIIVGETAILHCSFENVLKIGEYRKAQIWWTKMPTTSAGRAVVLASGSTIRIPDDRLKVVSFPDNGFSVLVIRNSVEEDSAEYKCSIPTVSGYKIGYQKLSVEAAPDSRVQSNEKERVVEAGDTVPFFCLPNFDNVDNSQLSVWWTAKGPTGINLKLDGNKEKVHGNRFQIEDITKDMEGIFTCHVENPEGLPIRKHFSVVLKEKPWKIEAYKQNLNVDTLLSKYTKDARVGEKVNLRCDSGGNPVPAVRWMKNGRQITPVENKVFITSYKPSYRPHAVVSKLVVSNFRLLDQGKYTCIVENELGALERDFDVKVAREKTSTSSNSNKSKSQFTPGRRDDEEDGDQYLASRKQEILYKRKHNVGSTKVKNEDLEGSGDY